MADRIVTADALTDPGVVAELVALSGRQWATADRRVAGTLWWYTTSSILLTPFLTRLAEVDLAPDPELSGVRLHINPEGRLLNAQPTRLLSTVDELPGRLRTALEAVLPVLAEASGTRVRPLWAITADSLANVLLRAWRGLGDPDRGAAQATELAAAIGAPMPVPRFVEVAVRAGSPPVRLVRRVSCCLIYQAGFAKCASCPHQEPFERLDRMAEAARLL
ncbi:(2Fe-2S)-binding protein [Kutzneria viridogrisea]|uniref:Ferric iron reductase protein FhuF n=1 Tax=Kutzneria viridogrisea TaxID=47990 RepID=A0ABR6BU05_9PSEU|nr:ferric iron reductase protein FhuF [Kutzneria viridogrisea]